MLAKYFAVVLLAALTVAEMPSYMTVCGRRNPNLDKCMKEAGDALRDRLKAGIPDIGLPPQDPLHIEKFSLSDTDMLKASAHDVTITGLGDFVTQSMHADFEAQQFQAMMSFKKIIFDGVYDVNSRIIIPISGRGPIHIVAHNVECSIIMKYKFVKKNGVDHIYYAPGAVITSLTLKDWEASFNPSATMDSTLVGAINTALQGGRREIFETLKPSIEKVISELTMDLANKVNDKFTFDELFPDRE